MLDGVAVRLKTPTVDRDVTHLVEGDLSFTTQAPGGEVQCSFRLNAGYDAFPDLGQMSRVWVTDRHGRMLWGRGYADNPGKSYDGAEGFDLTFKGGSSLAEEESRPLLYIDRTLDSWETSTDAQYGNGSTGTGGRPNADGVEGLLLSLGSGAPIAPGGKVRMWHEGLRASDMELGAFSMRYVFGSGAGAGYTGGPFTPYDGWIVSGTTTEQVVAVSSPSITAGTKTLAINLGRTGAATNISSDSVWLHARDVVVKGLLRNADGTARAVNGSAAYTTADLVVTDIVGRGLVAIDAATAEIATSQFEIDQLVYADGATAAQVLDDLTQFEPDHFWWIGGAGSETGHMFRWAPWPTEPRYELWSDDGVTFPGSEAALCDRVTITWEDTNGRKKSTTYTLQQKVTQGAATTRDMVALATLDGRQRSAPRASLPDGLGSEANAAKAAWAILDAANADATSGSATIARRVRDIITGEWHDPAALRAGELARVADLGITQRVTATDATVSRSGQENALTLGTPVRSFVDLLSGQRVHRWALPS